LHVCYCSQDIHKSDGAKTFAGRKTLPSLRAAACRTREANENSLDGHFRGVLTRGVPWGSGYVEVYTKSLEYTLIGDRNRTPGT